MDADLSWTTALGNAVIDQLQDVMAMIQQLRAEASASGYLQTNAFWVVVWEDDYWQHRLLRSRLDLRPGLS